MKSPLGHLKITETSKTYMCVIFVQSTYAGLAMFTKTALTKGMSPYAFVVYRQVFATLALAPFALFLERDESDSLSRFLVCKIFFVAFFGITLPLNLYVFGINYTSATLASASANTIPVITLILAVTLRMERISIKKWHGFAKVLGTIVCLSGAMVVVFVKGPSVYPEVSQIKTSHQFIERGDQMQWIKGCVIMLLSMTFMSLWLTMQGVVVNGVAYWLRIWVIEKRGPVFVSSFIPLTIVITTTLSVILWKEVLHWGSVGGVVLLVAGLYGVLWGKHREAKTKATENKSKANKVETIPECDSGKTTSDIEAAANSFAETRRPPE